MTDRQIKIAAMHNMNAKTDAELGAMAARLLAGATEDAVMGSHIIAGAKTTIAYAAQAVIAARR